MKRAALLAALLFAMEANAASFITGERLYALLTDQDPFSRAQASGYIAGVTDTGNGLGPTKMNWCFAVPNGVNANQVAAVVTRFLEQNAAKRALGASGLVEEALSKAYPCKK
ncbi:MAG TPA: Rap1a/Tai family immunity protein [Burkholderiales bacterium]|jgi:hypothetical protein|nr:Rap1a/Tai family immunity protein [Burkholderiales bacterium]